MLLLINDWTYSIVGWESICNDVSRPQNCPHGSHVSNRMERICRDRDNWKWYILSFFFLLFSWIFAFSKGSKHEESVKSSWNWRCAQFDRDLRSVIGNEWRHSAVERLCINSMLIYITLMYYYVMNSFHFEPIQQIVFNQQRFSSTIVYWGDNKTCMGNIMLENCVYVKDIQA